MAARDISAAIISRDGLAIYLKTLAMAVGGTYSAGTTPADFKVVLTVPSDGFGGTAIATNPTRTIHATFPVILPYSSGDIANYCKTVNIGAVTGGPFQNGETVTQATSGATAYVITDCPCSPLILTDITGSPDNSHVWTGGTSGATATPVQTPQLVAAGTHNQQGGDGSDLWIVLALSEPIHDVEAGITATIAAGLYNDGADSHAVTALAVTNQSALDYPPVVMRWGAPGDDNCNLMIGSTGLYVELIGFQGYGDNGKPLSAAKITLTDQHSHTITVVLSAMTESENKAGLYTFNKRWTVADLATLTDGDTVTVQGYGYPVIGDANSVTNSTGGTFATPHTFYPLKFRLDKTDARLRYLYVSPAAGTPAGDDSTGTGTRLAPYATMAKAVIAGAALNGDGKADGLHVRLMDGNHLIGDGSGAQSLTLVGAVTIEADPLATTAAITEPNGTDRYVWTRTLIKNLPVSGNAIHFSAPGALVIHDSLTWTATVSGCFDGDMWMIRSSYDNATLTGAASANQCTLAYDCDTAASYSGNAPWAAASCLVACRGTDVGKYWLTGVGGRTNALIYDCKGYKLTDGAIAPAGPLTGFFCVASVFDSATGSQPLNEMGVNSHSNVGVWNSVFAGERCNWEADYVGGTFTTATNFSCKYNSFNYLAFKCDRTEPGGAGTGHPKLIGHRQIDYLVNCFGNNVEFTPDINFPIGIGINNTRATNSRFTNDNSQHTCSFAVTGIIGTFHQWEHVSFSDGKAGTLLTSASPHRVRMDTNGSIAVATTTMTGAGGATGTVGVVTAGTGGGDYRLSSTSPLLGKVAAGRAVITADIAGRLYRNDGTDAAGSFNPNAAPVLTLASTTASVTVGQDVLLFAGVTITDADGDNLTATAEISDAQKLTWKTPLPAGWNTTFDSDVIQSDSLSPAALQAATRLLQAHGENADNGDHPTVLLTVDDGTDTDADTVTVTTLAAAGNPFRNRGFSGLRNRRSLGVTGALA